MNQFTSAVFRGTGSYIPSCRVVNDDFLDSQFYDANGARISMPGEEIVRKFEKITGIKERRYATDDQVTSDLACFAAAEAIQSAGIEKETIDYIIAAHNFGDVKKDNRRSDCVPGVAARVKHKLGIAGPASCFDVIFGCAGWLQGMILADSLIRSGSAKRVLVVGAETLSRVSDPHDRDSMLYADGAGAVIVEATTTHGTAGIVAHSSRSDTLYELDYLKMDNSYDPGYDGSETFLKMQGRKLYEYALLTVPQAIKDTIDKAGYLIKDVKKILLHQANTKMNEAILKRLFELYGQDDIPADIMPMTIERLGNSSVATIPTLLDMLLKGKVEGHSDSYEPGDILVFASVGAGMNVNALVYRMP